METRRKRRNVTTCGRSRGHALAWMMAAAVMLTAGSAYGAGVPFVVDGDRFFDYELTTGVAAADADEPRDAWASPPGWGGGYVGATYEAASHDDFEEWVDDVGLGISQFSLWVAGGTDARAWGEELTGNAVSAETPEGWLYDIYDNTQVPDFQGTGQPHQRITFYTGLDAASYPYFISPDNSVGAFNVTLGDIQRWDGSDYVDYDPTLGDDYRFWISFDEVWMDGQTPNAAWFESGDFDMPHWMQGATGATAVPSPTVAGAGLVLLGGLGVIRPRRRRPDQIPTHDGPHA